MEQLITPNPNIPYTGGYCERFIENTTGQSGVWPSATAAWNAGNGNHPGEQPPVGFSVPVYFALGSTSDGHVALMLPDGRVASSTQEGDHTTAYIHPNLQNLISMYAQYNNGCTYLGWSECIGNEQVIKEDTVAIIQDADNWYNRCNITHIATRGRTLDRAVFETFVGQDFLHFVEACEDDPEANTVTNWQNVGQQAVTDDWQGQITSLTAQVSALQAQLLTAPASEITTTPDPVVVPPVVEVPTSTPPKTGIWSAILNFLKGFVK